MQTHTKAPATPIYRIIALDLDGTLLNSQKQLTPANAAVLARAAAQGAEIVPTTGRFYSGMPECVRALPFVHYVISVNGAQVYDLREDRAISRAELPAGLAVEVLSYLDTQDVIYDCYQENWGYMTAAMQDRVLDYVTDPNYQKMVREFRTPVPELKAHLRQRGLGVQKLQLFTPDPALRLRLLEELPRRFPETAVSSASPNNVEINAADATKGEALRQLAAHLGLDICQTVAFGDGLNDLSMLRAAGLGIAMANACPEALAAADRTTASCDEDGVARALEALGF